MKTRLVPWHLGIALLLLTPVAAAQTKAQKAATEAFRACHEMEDYGDATPCWKRWLEKYKNVGGEAEVILAEERAGNKKPAPKKEEPEPPRPAPPPAEPKEEPAKEEAAAEAEAEPAPEPPAEEAAAVPVAISATGPDPSEHRMIGLGLQLHVGANFYFLDSAHYAPYGAIQSPDGWVQQQFGLPQIMYGGGGALSYDVSGLVGWSEFSVRAGGDFLLGNGTATQTRLIVVELLAEKHFHLGNGLGLYLGLGPTMTMAKVRSVPFYNPVVLGELNSGSGDIEPVAQMPGQIVDFEATRFGAATQVGFEFLLSPNLALRAELPVRFSFPSKGYDSANPAKSQCPTDLTDPASVSNSPDQDSQGCWGFNTRKDTFASVGARVGAKLMF